MRTDLKNLISWTRGPSAWDELLRMEAKIRKDRQKQIYDQQEARRKLKLLDPQYLPQFIQEFELLMKESII